LLAKKIENIQKIINNSDKSKPHIKMTTQGSSHKQIIILMGKENTEKFMISTSNYITNINSALKSIKSNVMVDYIRKEPIGVTIVTDKVVLSSNIQVIENFVKNVKNINSEDIELPRLPQLKSYLKIIDIPYLIENSNITISLDFVEMIIKSNHIFNNLSLMLKLQVIKVLSKSNIVIIWINI